MYLLDLKMTLQEKEFIYIYKFTVSFLVNFCSTICVSSSMSDVVTVLKHNKPIREVDASFYLISLHLLL